MNVYEFFDNLEKQVLPIIEINFSYYKHKKQPTHYLEDKHNCYNKSYYLANRKRIIERQNIFNKKHKDRLKQYDITYKNKHKERLKQHNILYRANKFSCL